MKDAPAARKLGHQRYSVLLLCRPSKRKPNKRKPADDEPDRTEVCPSKKTTAGKVAADIRASCMDALVWGRMGRRGGKGVITVDGRHLSAFVLAGFSIRFESLLAQLTTFVGDISTRIHLNRPLLSFSDVVVYDYFSHFVKIDF